MALCQAQEAGAGDGAVNVSVIIPAHNNEQTLDRAVQSAVEQAHRVIIVNDASSDQTGAIAKELAQEYYAVEVVATGSVVPVGVCAARNIAISHAPGPLILPLDADDWLESHAVQQLTQRYETGTFVYGGWHEWQGANTRPRTPAPITTLNHKNVAQATFLFAKADWEAVGGYDSDFGLCAEDYALMVALQAGGIRGLRIDQAVYNYTVSADGRAGRCGEYFEMMKQVGRQKWPGVYA